MITPLSSDNLLLTLMRAGQTARLATVIISHENMVSYLRLLEQKQNMVRQSRNLVVEDAHRNHHAQVVIRLDTKL